MIRIAVTFLFTLSACKVEPHQLHLDKRKHRTVGKASQDANPNRGIDLLFTVGGSVNIEESFTFENGINEQTIKLKSELFTMQSALEMAAPPAAETEEFKTKIDLETEYTLTGSAIFETLVVKLDDEELQELTGYTREANKIKLVNPVVDNQNLEISYVPEHTPTYQATLSGNVIPESILVSINNTLVGSQLYQYNTMTKTVSLNYQSDEPLEIKADYTVNLGNQLDYNLATTPSSPYAIVLYDEDTMEELMFNITDSTLSIHPDDFTMGRNLKIVYKDDEDISEGLNLSQLPITNSFSTDFQQELCISGDGLSVEGRKIFVNCELESPMKVTFKYSYKHNRRNFEINDISLPDLGTWEVYYDDVRTSDWTREGNVVIVSEELIESSKVRIRFIPTTK